VLVVILFNIAVDLDSKDQAPFHLYILRFLCHATLRFFVRFELY